MNGSTKKIIKIKKQSRKLIFANGHKMRKILNIRESYPIKKHKILNVT